MLESIVKWDLCEHVTGSQMGQMLRTSSFFSVNSLTSSEHDAQIFVNGILSGSESIHQFSHRCSYTPFTSENRRRIAS